MWFIVVCTLISTHEYASLLFSLTFFCIVSACWPNWQKFLKVHNAAHNVWKESAYKCSAYTFKSESVFQLSTNLDKSTSFVIFDIVVKTDPMSISVALVKFHWFGINWHVFLYIIIQKTASQAESWKYFQIWFFPRFGGKMAAFWACACKLSWTLFSPARVHPLYGAGRKESSGTGLPDVLKSWILSSSCEASRNVTGVKRKIWSLVGQ